MLDTTFLDELASKAPTPGGGGACAYVGALAAALSSMVGNLTVGKKSYAAVEQEVRQRMEKLEQLRVDLLQAIDDDARAFTPLAAAYGLPSASEEEKAAKNAAIQAASLEACQAPLHIMRLCLEVIGQAHYLACNGSRLAVSDAGASAELACAAVRAASLNVFINTASMDDKTLAASLEQQADDLISQATDAAAVVSARVAELIRPNR